MMTTLFRALLASALLLAIAAPVAATDDASPEPMLLGAPVEITLPIDSPDEAHAAIVAAGAPFADFVAVNPDLIGASATFEAIEGSEAWTIVYSYGWGDCPAGCINGHTFTYEVAVADGNVSYTGDEGDELPTDAPEALIGLSLMNDGQPTDDDPVVISPNPGDVDDADANAMLLMIGGGALIVAMSFGWVLIQRRKRGE